jgi:hypothetical protein
MTCIRGPVAEEQAIAPATAIDNNAVLIDCLLKVYMKSYGCWLSKRMSSGRGFRYVSVTEELLETFRCT